MALWLGVDGGGTGCRAAVADASGLVLGRADAGPANIASDLPGALASILHASTAALSQIVGPDHAVAGLAALHAGLGLAGANAAGATDALIAALPFARARVETDAITAVKGALRDGDGIVAALGTGSVFARQQAGTIRQIGGYGLVMGDEGSGARLGRSLLARALRAFDGLEAMTPLLSAVIDEWRGPDGIVRFAISARPADFATLARRMVSSDDPAAVALMQAATPDVARWIDHLQQGAALPVVFIGGLGPTYAARLAGRWPIVPALGTSLDGALMLAREAG